MKYLLFLVPIIICKAQTRSEFSGTVIYQERYVPRDDYDEEQIRELMGDLREFTISEGNYLSESNGSLAATFLYIRDLSHLYQIMQDSLRQIDETIQDGDEILSFHIDHDSTIILGYSCKRLIVESLLARSSYWFSDSLYIDPIPYSKHDYGNWAFLTQQMSSVALKYELEFADLTLKGEAIQISARPVPKEYFLSYLDRAQGK